MLSKIFVGRDFYFMKILFFIIFLIFISSLLLPFTFAESKSLSVHVIVSSKKTNNSENISSESIGSNNPIQGEVIKGDKETTIKQSVTSLAFYYSFNKLFSYKPKNTWFVSFALIGIILVLIIIYLVKIKFVRKKRLNKNLG